VPVESPTPTPVTPTLSATSLLNLVKTVRGHVGDDNGLENLSQALSGQDATEL